jgi:hypothetical protein
MKLLIVGIVLGVIMGGYLGMRLVETIMLDD